MTPNDLLRDPARSGVYRLPETAAWVSQVSATDYAVWRVDLAKVRSKAESPCRAREGARIARLVRPQLGCPPGLSHGSLVAAGAGVRRGAGELRGPCRERAGDVRDDPGGAPPHRPLVGGRAGPLLGVRRRSRRWTI